jgi:hypothetical protein
VATGDVHISSSSMSMAAGWLLLRHHHSRLGLDLRKVNQSKTKSSWGTFSPSLDRSFLTGNVDDMSDARDSVRAMRVWYGAPRRSFVRSFVRLPWWS